MSEEGNSEKKEYPRPYLTADVIALGLGEGGRLSVLLIKRGRDPFKDHWAIPGGFCEPNESVEDAGARELKEETEIAGLELEQLGVYSAPGRDPRGWVVSVAFIGLVPSNRFGEARGSDDASDAKWWPIEHRPGKTPSFILERDGEKTGRLAFDHDDMLAAALKRIHKESDRFTLGLLPEQFNETELRTAFEAVLGEPLNTGVLIRVLTERKLIKSVGEGAEGERLFTRADRVAPPPVAPSSDNGVS
jgi:8-oxo-dGTP diphosphatase